MKHADYIWLFTDDHFGESIYDIPLPKLGLLMQYLVERFRGDARSKEVQAILAAMLNRFVEERRIN